MNTAAAVTLGGDIVLALTVGVLIWQTHVAGRATRAGVYQTISDQMLAIDRLFVDAPDLRAYFFANQPLPAKGLERERTLAAAELFIDFMDDVIAQQRHLPRYMSDSWSGYFRSVASTSPAIQEFWGGKRAWYDAHMQALLDPICALGKVDQTDPAGMTNDCRDGDETMAKSGEDRGEAEVGALRHLPRVREAHYDLRRGASRYAPIVGGFGALAVPAIIIVFTGRVGAGVQDPTLRVMAAGLLTVAMIGSLIGAFGLAAIGAETDESANLTAAGLWLAMPVVLSIAATLAAFAVLAGIYLAASGSIFVLITGIGGGCGIIFAAFSVLDSWGVGPEDDFGNWSTTQWIKSRASAEHWFYAMTGVGLAPIVAGLIVRFCWGSVVPSMVSAQTLVVVGVGLVVVGGMYGMYRTIHTRPQRGIRLWEGLATILGISLYVVTLLIFLPK